MTETRATDVTDRPELHDMLRALKRDRLPEEEYDPDYPPFDEDQFERDYYLAQKKRGGGYGSPSDF